MKLNQFRKHLCHHVIRSSGFVAILLLGGCVTKVPINQSNLCAVFQQYPHWYWEAKQAQQKWGLPIYVQMAIMKQESSFVADARPPRQKVMGVIPGARPTTAYGYAQATDGTWAHYQQSTGAKEADRDEFGDAVDFMGWYSQEAYRRLGIAKTNAYELYLAYHEGIGGYRSGSYRSKPWLVDIAKKVQKNADLYRMQLTRCESTIPKPSSWNQWMKSS